MSSLPDPRSDVVLPSTIRPLARRAVRRIAYGAIAVLGAVFRLYAGFSRSPNDPGPGKILVIRLDLLGDLVLSMPAVDSLRATYPQAEITLLTLPYTAPLAHLYPSVDRVVAIDTNRIRSARGLISPATWAHYYRVWRSLRSEHFDLAISLCGRMASLCAFLSGAARTTGYAREAYPFLLSDPVPGGRYRERMHEVEYSLRLVQGAGVGELHRRLHVPVDEGARASANSLLRAHSVLSEDRLMVIHPGSINGSAKRWPAESWSQFAREVGRRAAVKVVLTGAPNEEPIARTVVSRAENVISLVGKTDILQLAALIERADVVASGDSGPLHLAVALGRPLVAVYGPNDPAISGPYGAFAPGRLHRKDLPCSPCYSMAATAECPLGDPICMRLVTVKQMVTSALELLGAD